MPETQFLLDLLTRNVKTAPGVYSRAQIDLLRTRLRHMHKERPDTLADVNEEFLNKLLQIARNLVQPTEFEVLFQANAKLLNDVMLVLIMTVGEAPSPMAGQAFRTLIDVLLASGGQYKATDPSYFGLECAIMQVKTRKNKDEREELMIAITPELRRLTPLMRGDSNCVENYLNIFRELLIMAESQGGVRTLLENIRQLAAECGVVVNVPLKGRENLDMVFGAIGEAMMIQRPSTPPPNPGRLAPQQTR
ncbi:MAG: hypothetical protein AB7U41_02865 [Dongiaceae bacterium]